MDSVTQCNDLTSAVQHERPRTGCMGCYTHAHKYIYSFFRGSQWRMVFPPLIGFNSQRYRPPHGYHPREECHAYHVGTSRGDTCEGDTAEWEAPGVEFVPEAGVPPFRVVPEPGVPNGTIWA